MLRTSTRRRFAIAAFALGLAPRLAAAADLNADLKALVAAADKEGNVNLSWSQSTLGGSQGAELLRDGVNKVFGSHIKVTFTPGQEMARIANQLVIEKGAKQPASVDIYLGAAAQLAPLAATDLFEPVEWAKYLPGRVDAKNVETGGKFLRVTTGLSGVTYNTALAPSIPTSLQDFLKPEWKGKIATTAYAASFDVLLANDMWGRDKIIDYMRKLNAQVAGLIRCGDGERIATGEFAALVMDCTGQDSLVWRERGAPMDQAIPADAAQLRYYYVAVPTNARNPAAAKLVSLFLETPEGQKIAYDTWKADLHTYSGAHISKQIADNEAKGTVFKEITIDWWRAHPEIDANKGEFVKILSSRN